MFFFQQVFFCVFLYRIYDSFVIIFVQCMCVCDLNFNFFFFNSLMLQHLVKSSSVKYLYICYIFWSELRRNRLYLSRFEKQRKSIILFFSFTMIELLQTVPDQRSGSFRKLLLLLHYFHLLFLLLLHHSHYG